MKRILIVLSREVQVRYITVKELDLIQCFCCALGEIGDKLARAVWEMGILIRCAGPLYCAGD